MTSYLGAFFMPNRITSLGICETCCKSTVIHLDYPCRHQYNRAAGLVAAASSSILGDVGGDGSATS